MADGGVDAVVHDDDGEVGFLLHRGPQLRHVHGKAAIARQHDRLAPWYRQRRPDTEWQARPDPGTHRMNGITRAIDGHQPVRPSGTSDRRVPYP